MPSTPPPANGRRRGHRGHRAAAHARAEEAAEREVLCKLRKPPVERFTGTASVEKAINTLQAAQQRAQVDMAAGQEATKRIADLERFSRMNFEHNGTELEILLRWFSDQRAAKIEALIASHLTLIEASEDDAPRIVDIHMAAFGTNQMLLAQFPTPAIRDELRVTLREKTVAEI
ncbi:GNAT family acetyltransferase [Aspergillus terreus]|uniref:GNAT family acetyltransferase n=1 Tax=Aspergillus terreus TaxID=33178 RepID=A0A5M3Z8U8_ASPTE|nr:hypothetical protein ATETN484_0012003800 [Aspergillus terreus]GFF19286.1 GNAT family acetyltransferase [Aspergillus terreus]